MDKIFTAINYIIIGLQIFFIFSRSLVSFSVTFLFSVVFFGYMTIADTKLLNRSIAMKKLQNLVFMTVIMVALYYFFEILGKQPQEAVLSENVETREQLNPDIILERNNNLLKVIQDEAENAPKFDTNLDERDLERIKNEDYTEESFDADKELGDMFFEQAEAEEEVKERGEEEETEEEVEVEEEEDYKNKEGDENEEFGEDQKEYEEDVQKKEKQSKESPKKYVENMRELSKKWKPFKYPKDDKDLSTLVRKFFQKNQQEIEKFKYTPKEKRCSLGMKFITGRLGQKGWGNSLLSLYNTAVLAYASNRVLVIHYNSPNLYHNISLTTVDEITSLLTEADCKYTSNFINFQRPLKGLEDTSYEFATCADVDNLATTFLTIESLQSWSGPLIVSRNPYFKESAETLRYDFLGELIEQMTPLVNYLQEIANIYKKDDLYDLGIHIRHHSGIVDVRAKECVEARMKEYPIRTIFVASDKQLSIQKIVKIFNETSVSYFDYDKFLMERPDLFAKIPNSMQKGMTGNHLGTHGDLPRWVALIDMVVLATNSKRVIVTGKSTFSILMAALARRLGREVWFITNNGCSQLTTTITPTNTVNFYGYKAFKYWLLTQSHTCPKEKVTFKA